MIKEYDEKNELRDEKQNFRAFSNRKKTKEESRERNQDIELSQPHTQVTRNQLNLQRRVFRRKKDTGERARTISPPSPLWQRAIDENNADREDRKTT